VTNRSNPLDLRGRTVLVTGASSGIGRETAIALSELGARVIVTARRKEQLEATVAGMMGGPATAAYAASKAAVIGLTKSLASELAPEGVRVNCIAPGMVQSEMTEHVRQALSREQFAAIAAQHPLGVGATWDIASAAAYLLSDGGRWVTGQTLVVDGGFSAVRA
jgi:NAD(P)-dependent dehydrogenase (short-subunit alcohol dehydrogenase family)